MINLDLEDKNIVIDGLREMLDKDISYTARIGIEEAIEYLIDKV